MAANSAVLRIWPKFELVWDIMVLLVTCKCEDNPIKNEGARVLIRLYDFFSDAQGQLTMKTATEFLNINISDQWTDCNQILSEASFGWGKSCFRFCARLDWNSGVHGNG